MEPNPYHSPHHYAARQPNHISRTPPILVGLYAGLGFVAVFFFLLLAVVPPDPQHPIAFMEITFCGGVFGFLVAVMIASASSVSSPSAGIFSIFTLIIAFVLATALVAWLLLWVVSQVQHS